MERKIWNKNKGKEEKMREKEKIEIHERLVKLEEQTKMLTKLNWLTFSTLVINIVIQFMYKV